MCNPGMYHTLLFLTAIHVPNTSYHPVTHVNMDHICTYENTVC